MRPDCRGDLRSRGKPAHSCITRSCPGSQAPAQRLAAPSRNRLPGQYVAAVAHGIESLPAAASRTGRPLHCHRASPADRSRKPCPGVYPRTPNAPCPRVRVGYRPGPSAEAQTPKTAVGSRLVNGDRELVRLQAVRRERNSHLVAAHSSVRQDIYRVRTRARRSFPTSPSIGVCPLGKPNRIRPTSCRRF